MNESQLATVRERDAHLVRLIEAITDVQSTHAWSTLKEEFDGEIAKMNRLLLSESKKKEVELPEVYRYQGRIESTKKYALDALLADYRQERETIKRKLS